MKLSIGFIVYNQSSFKYLPYFLPSLEKSLNYLEKIEINIFALDNSDNFDGNFFYLKNFFSQSNLKNNFFLIKSDYNTGFAKGFNLMINRAIEDDSDLFLALNPDIFLESDSIHNLLSIFLKNIDNFNKISSLSPKILKWDFDNNKKTEHIDSLGIGIDYCHRFFDINQGLVDKDNLENKEIFGASGAMALYNLEALKNISYNNDKYLEFFDELMFMYKEDVDLSYRLQLSGWKSYLIATSVVYHDRTLDSSSNNPLNLLFRKRKNKLRSWSFLNQLIILLKFKKIKFSFKILLFSSIRLFFLLIYGLLLEFKQIVKIVKLRNEIAKRRNNLKIKDNSVLNLEKLMKSSRFY